MHYKKTDIMLYKQWVVIELKDGRVLYTDKSIDDVEKVLDMKKDCIRIGDDIFGRFEFKHASPKKIGGIQNEILNVQDRDVRDYLQQTYNQRQAEGKRTNGFKHLRQIYLDHKHNIFTS